MPNSIEQLEEELMIVHNSCFSCGQAFDAKCNRPAMATCAREFHGGTRQAYMRRYPNPDIKIEKFSKEYINVR